MMKPTLIILAAGMGSRYGGLKQLDQLGPNGEAIIDYSLFDAVRAGFGKVVFVIREDFAQEFRERFEPVLLGRIDFEYVFQSLDKIPPGYPVNPQREKPWGTAHAVYMAADTVREPMAVINADDFYGREAYQVMADFLTQSDDSSEYAMIGYRVSNTLSEHGSVSRGVCMTDGKGYLTSVVERTQIKRDDGGIFYYEADGRFALDEETPVSMNFWGFKPNVFTFLEEGFTKFIAEHGQELKTEYFIPLLINENIQTGRISTRVLDCNSSWFGVTYREDKLLAQERIRSLISRGDYPTNLWT
jgi:NDP-sugar pyrophosphorylase family protein